MLDSRQMAVDDIKTKLIEYASLQYNDIHNEKYEAQRLKDLFLNQKATDGFSADLFNRTVTAVSFDSDNNVGDLTMKDGFMNKYHKSIFEQATAHIDTTNNVLVAAVYLLTADFKLWKQTKNHVEKNRICFGRFKPVNCTETGYTVYSAAKDIYLGTKHFTLSDLADKHLIPPKLFEVICIAMTIKRYGVKVLDRAKEDAA